MFFWLLILLSTIAAGVGLFHLTEATVGVGLVALGCWLGILARIRLVRTEPQPVSQAEVDNLYRRLSR